VGLARSADGFTLVEIVVALVILTVGVLGLAGTTALVVRQVTASRIATERTVALQSAIEQVRAVDYDVLDGASSDTVGRFTVSWKVSDAGRSKLVQFVMTGPGMRSVPGTLGMIGSSVTDTFTYRMIRP
jgi:prepilin-type N-terminal cleavage/methylation domain-containing protein